MSLTVNDRANRVATFRFVEVRLMEITAMWTPTTPEMEVKVMFGRHIWDFAQHADLLGKRTFELRQPEHYTRAPVDAYVALIDDLAREEDTSARLAALYDGLLPALADRYRRYLVETDTLLDQPTAVIMERILTDITRMQREAQALRSTAGARSVPVDDIRARERAVAEMTA
ncbi:MAG TPA: hypothetical protein VER58_00815 [Thermoanaerobaculia bacterium]|nr:hypothetical protein [Thermoanaerobaculia bacterium]